MLLVGCAGVNEGSTSPTSDKPLGGHHRSRSRLDLTEELAGEGATQKSQQAKKGGATKGVSQGGGGSGWACIPYMTVEG